MERSERKTSAQRDKYLAEKAEAYASQGEVSATQYLKQIKQSESMSRVFQRCANARGAHRFGGISTIEVPQDPNVPPKDCTEWKTLDCPQEIENALLKQNRKHFGQSQGTPSTVPPLSQEINFKASTATSELILNGSYTHDDLDDMTQLLIDHLQ